MKIKSGFVLERVGDSYLACATGALAGEFHAFVRLNATGAFMWEQLVSGDITQQELVCRMRGEYDVSEEIAARDAAAFIQKLRDNNILDD